MTGTLLVSLDCEGKWGMADDPGMLKDDSINDRTIRAAYDSLFRLFETSQIRATFAVVGLFVGGPSEARRHFGNVETEMAHAVWSRIPRRMLSTGDNSGWFYEELPRRILVSGQHEIASHGYSHLPFTYNGVSESTARYELECMRSLSEANSWHIESMVFPRNEVAQVHLLSQYGIVRFRDGEQPNTRFVRAMRSLEEFNVLRRAELLPGDKTRVPAGRFVNWRSGLRRSVPSRVTVRRWQHILDDAERRDRCAHLWFHPHNLITGSQQLELVTRIVALAAERVRRGTMRSLLFRELN